MSLLKDWNKHLKLVSFAIAAMPIIGAHAKFRFIWPPIGSLSVYGAYFVAVLAWLLSRAPLKFRSQGSAKAWMWIGLVTMVFAICFYGRLLSRYVVGVPTRDDGIQYRTVGSQRTAAVALVEARVPNPSDERILEIAGLSDDAIKEMWTPESVARVRWELFLAVAVIWCAANFSAGAFARSTFNPGQV